MPFSSSKSKPPLPTKQPLSTIINTKDFEHAARVNLSPKTWAFYSSAATDCVTRDRNTAFFERIWFRPRCLRNVSRISTSTTMLGHKLDLPLYVAPAALAGLVHPDGEKALAQGCFGGPTRVAQVVSTNASFDVGFVVSSGRNADNHRAFERKYQGQDISGDPPPPFIPLFFQLYVDRDRSNTERLLRSVADQGITTLFLTVDAPVAGKREADERVAIEPEAEPIKTAMSGQTARNDKRGGGLGRTMGEYIDSSLSWDDLTWLRDHWRKCTADNPHGKGKDKIVLKGVQSWMDAKRAADAGLAGIAISNHGGRSLDTSPPAVMVLLELQRNCPEIFGTLEVYVDSGIRRGTDVVKCLCLGATAVGMGRSPLYALSYGREGVERLVEIMRDEVETTMAMLGVTSVEELHPGLVSTLDVDHLVSVGTEHPYATGLPLGRTRPTRLR